MRRVDHRLDALALGYAAANMNGSAWATNDFRVKMLDWIPARGSRLAHTCRRCGRSFTVASRLSLTEYRAIDGEALWKIP
jgi:hypothetical protein